MTGVTRPSVRNLPTVLRFWIDANPLLELPGIDLKYFIRVFCSRQYSRRIFSVPFLNQSFYWPKVQLAI